MRVQKEWKKIWHVAKDVQSYVLLSIGEGKHSEAS